MAHTFRPYFLYPHDSVTFTATAQVTGDYQLVFQSGFSNGVNLRFSTGTDKVQKF